jgi:hypothetical protein
MTTLFNTGLQESEYGTGIYSNIMNTNLQQDADLGSAVGNLAAAMVPGNTGSKGTSPTAAAASPLASANA